MLIIFRIFGSIGMYGFIAHNSTPTTMSVTTNCMSGMLSSNPVCKRFCSRLSVLRGLIHVFGEDRTSSSLSSCLSNFQASRPSVHSFSRNVTPVSAPSLRFLLKILESCDNRTGGKKDAPTARRALAESRKRGKGVGGQTFFYLLVSRQRHASPGRGITAKPQTVPPAVVSLNQAFLIRLLLQISQRGALSGLWCAKSMANCNPR
jgi:hypothetical protein